MPQLKPSFVQDIRAALASSRFTGEDFGIVLPDSGRVLIRINFLHKQQYSLSLCEDETHQQITIDQKLFGSRTERVRQTSHKAIAVPGKFKTSASDELSDIGDFLRCIPEWCESIRADLYAMMPVRDPVAHLRQELQTTLDDLVDQPDDFFGEEELSVIDKRFDQLQEELARLREQFSFTNDELKKLQHEIQEFKSSARAYTKGVWAKVTANKLMKVAGQIAKSPESRAFLFQQIPKALGLRNGP